jgi:hypothetical protein
MKNLITILLLLFLNSSYSQTKSETIDWIKSKLELYSYNSLNKNSMDKIELDECYCTFYYTSHTNMGELKNIVKIPTNIVRINEWLVPSKSNVEHFVYKQKRKKIKPVSRYYNKENSFPIYIREGESDLSNRLLKAFKHLKTFCKTKNEAF